MPKDALQSLMLQDKEPSDEDTPTKDRRRAERDEKETAEEVSVRILTLALIDCVERTPRLFFVIVFHVYMYMSLLFLTVFYIFAPVRVYGRRSRRSWRRCRLRRTRRCSRATPWRTAPPLPKSVLDAPSISRNSYGASKRDELTMHFPQIRDEEAAGGEVCSPSPYLSCMPHPFSWGSPVYCSHIFLPPAGSRSTRGWRGSNGRPRGWWVQ